MARRATPKNIRPEIQPAVCTDHAAGCLLPDLFRLLGKSHTLDILHLFVVQEPAQSLRFVEVQTILKLSPNTLSERLKELVDAGLLTRQAYNEIPPRVDYQATQKARELDGVFEALISWSQRNNLEPTPSAPAESAVG